jgi:Spy/CpxP family protein refolding chaperone
LSALALGGLIAGVAACSAESGASEAREPNEAAQAPLSAEGKMGRERGGPGGKHGFGGPGHGGPDHLLRAALNELELTDAQKTAIEGALSKAAPGRPNERGPKDSAAFVELAAGVRAGKIDSASVLAKIDGDLRGGEGPGAAMAEGIQTLHATLTKEQRRALVDIVKKRMEEHGTPGMRADMDGDRGPGRGRPDKDGARGPEGARGDMPRGGPLGFMLHSLNLTDAQRESVEKALAAQRPAAPDEAAMKKNHDAFRTEMSARLEAFAADSFDAKAFVAPPAGAEGFGPKQHMERMVKDLAVVVPLLDPAQRETLAAQLEKGPPAHPGHPGEHEGARGHGPKGAPSE